MTASEIDEEVANVDEAEAVKLPAQLREEADEAYAAGLISIDVTVTDKDNTWKRHRILHLQPTATLAETKTALLQELPRQLSGGEVVFERLQHHCRVGEPLTAADEQRSLVDLHIHTRGPRQLKAIVTRPTPQQRVDGSDQGQERIVVRVFTHRGVPISALEVQAEDSIHQLMKRLSAGEGRSLNRLIPSGVPPSSQRLHLLCNEDYSLRKRLRPEKRWVDYGLSNGAVAFADWQEVDEGQVDDEVEVKVAVLSPLAEGPAGEALGLVELDVRLSDSVLSVKRQLERRLGPSSTPHLHFPLTPLSPAGQRSLIVSAGRRLPSHRTLAECGVTANSLLGVRWEMNEEERSTWTERQRAPQWHAGCPFGHALPSSSSATADAPASSSEGALTAVAGDSLSPPAEAQISVFLRQEPNVQLTVACTASMTAGELKQRLAAGDFLCFSQSAKSEVMATPPHLQCLTIGQPPLQLQDDRPLRWYDWSQQAAWWEKVASVDPATLPSIQLKVVGILPIAAGVRCEVFAYTVQEYGRLTIADVKIQYTRNPHGGRQQLWIRLQPSTEHQGCCEESSFPLPDDARVADLPIQGLYTVRAVRHNGRSRPRPQRRDDAALPLCSQRVHGGDQAPRLPGGEGPAS